LAGAVKPHGLKIRSEPGTREFPDLFVAVIQMQTLINELKVKIIEVLNLMDVTPDDITADDPLVGGTLGIDSIDVLEMVIMIDKDYGVKIDNRELGVQVFATLKTLAEFISTNSPNFSN
jgi:acyl carrier protein